MKYGLAYNGPKCMLMAARLFVANQTKIKIPTISVLLMKDKPKCTKLQINP